jgi:hypothetical protein
MDFSSTSLLQLLKNGYVPPNVAKTEGAFVHFSNSGVTVVFSIFKPAPEEQKALSESGKVGITKKGPVAFLTFDFGGILSYDCSFHAGLEAEKNVPDLSGMTRVPLTLVGFNLMTQHVFEERTVTLPKNVSRQFISLVEGQRRVPISQREQLLNVKSVYERFPNVKSLQRSMLARGYLGI